jgi:hypothetical protein
MYILKYNESLEELLTAGPDCDQMRRSLYAENTALLFELFPRENILTLIFERDFSKGGSRVAVRKLQAFLGLPDDVALNSEQHEAKNYFVRPGLATAPNTVDTVYGPRSYQPLDIVVELLQEMKFYDLKISSSADPQQVEWMCAYARNITTKLSRAQVRDYYQRYFQDDVEKLRNLLGDSIPEWDPETIPIPEYKALESRQPDLLPLSELNPLQIKTLRLACSDARAREGLAHRDHDQVIAMLRDGLTPAALAEGLKR